MNCSSTTNGKSYDYNIPREYLGTTTDPFPCYKKLATYGACKLGGIVPPTPATVIPDIFKCEKPHPYHPGMSNKMKPDNCNFVGNRHYYNEIGGGANTNTQDTYRKISMPNQALSCGGLGNGYLSNIPDFRPGFNDICGNINNIKNK